MTGLSDGRHEIIAEAFNFIQLLHDKSRTNMAGRKLRLRRHTLLATKSKNVGLENE